MPSTNLEDPIHWYRRVQDKCMCGRSSMAIQAPDEYFYKGSYYDIVSRHSMPNWSLLGIVEGKRMRLERLNDVAGQHQQLDTAVRWRPHRINAGHEPMAKSGRWDISFKGLMMIMFVTLNSLRLISAPCRVSERFHQTLTYSLQPC